MAPSSVSCQDPWVEERERERERVEDIHKRTAMYNIDKSQSIQKQQQQLTELSNQLINAREAELQLQQRKPGGSTQPELQAWPSTPTVPTLDMDAEFQADPGTVLSTIHGLASVNESMVTSLSSITNLSVVSNTTAKKHSNRNTGL